MKKSVKRTIALMVTIAVILGGVYYFVETYHAMGVWMHFSPQAAVGEGSDVMLFEYQDDDFYVGFNKEGKTTSAKKNVALWVKYDFVFFDGWQDFPSVQVATVNEKVYLYGSVCSETIQEVKLLQHNFEVVDSQFFGQKVQYEGVHLCFCLVVSVDEIKFPSYSLVFLDEENRIVPLVEDNNLYRESLVAQIYNPEKHLQVVGNDNISRISDAASNEVILNKQLYFYNEYSGGYTIRRVTEIAKTWIPATKDFMFVQHEKKIFELGYEQSNDETYTSFYKVKYTDDLKRVFE